MRVILFGFPKIKIILFAVIFIIWLISAISFVRSNDGGNQLLSRVDQTDDLIYRSKRSRRKSKSNRNNIKQKHNSNVDNSNNKGNKNNINFGNENMDNFTRGNKNQSPLPSRSKINSRRRRRKINHRTGNNVYNRDESLYDANFYDYKNYYYYDGSEEGKKNIRKIKRLKENIKQLKIAIKEAKAALSTTTESTITTTRISKTKKVSKFRKSNNHLDSEI
uniref:BZIP domain-containing protein n=1 Tax=Strongyloides papillosus TaxID=174720 RepID=A0A0N5BY13_STREA